MSSSAATRLTLVPYADHSFALHLQAQQNFVIPVQTNDGGTEYIWTGDRWQSGGCPDPSKEGTPACNPDAGIKYMDLQYWSPLVFAKDPKSGFELPQQLSWLDWFVIDMAA